MQNWIKTVVVAVSLALPGVVLAQSLESLVNVQGVRENLSLIHISEPTRLQSYNLVCRLLLEKKKKKKKKTQEQRIDEKQ